MEKPKEGAANANRCLQPIVPDFATLLARLTKKVDRTKLSKAVRMLKAERFQLYSEVTDTSVCGIVKSQTDPDLIYACWLDCDGRYACCTQNLNRCGGLRGGVCKHGLVLIIGLAKSGKLDLDKADRWAGQTRYQKSILQKDFMSGPLLRFKEAEAGDIDWRPTETVPEDYYAL
jgi:hypothetical protein